MKICFLSLYSGIINRGAEIYAHELGNALASDHQVSLFQGGKKIEKARYQVYSILSKFPQEIPDRGGISKKLFKDPASQAIKEFTLRCLPQIENTCPDVIIPINNGWQTMLCRRVANKVRAKLIVSSQSGLGKFGPGYDEWINTLMGVDCYVALTYEQRRRLRLFSPWQRIEVIPNGVDIDKFSPKNKPTELNLRKPIILCVSALSKWKNVDKTIMAVSKMKTKPSLLVLGKGSEEEQSYIQQLGRNLLDNRFMLKSVAHEEIPNYYKCADVFTLASQSSEAFGIAYVEAMSTNLGIVATDDPQRREIVGDAGLLVNPNDTDQYASKLSEALDKDWGNIPRERSLTFSWTKIADKYSKMFKSLIRE